MPATVGSQRSEVAHLSRDFDFAAFHFPRLPGTRAEGEEIAALLGVQPHLGASALEAQLKALHSPRVLHIATHGFFLPNQGVDLKKSLLSIGQGPWGRFSPANLENPLLRSGFTLAGANTWLQGQPMLEEAEDGLLTAEDVTGLDLLDTDLVVLSALRNWLGRRPRWRRGLRPPPGFCFGRREDARDEPMESARSIYERSHGGFLQTLLDRSRKRRSPARGAVDDEGATRQPDVLGRVYLSGTLMVSQGGLSKALGGKVPYSISMKDDSLKLF